MTRSVPIDRESVEKLAMNVRNYGGLADHVEVAATLLALRSALDAQRQGETMTIAELTYLFEAVLASYDRWTAMPITAANYSDDEKAAERQRREQKYETDKAAFIASLRTALDAQSAPMPEALVGLIECLRLGADAIDAGESFKLNSSTLKTVASIIERLQRAQASAPLPADVAETIEKINMRHQRVLATCEYEEIAALLKGQAEEIERLQRALTEAQRDHDLVRDLLHDRAVGWQRQAEEAERDLTSALERLKVVERVIDAARAFYDASTAYNVADLHLAEGDTPDNRRASCKAFDAFLAQEHALGDALSLLDREEKTETEG